MDNKTDNTKNPQKKNPMNGLQYPNTYNLYIQNQVQNLSEYEFQKNGEKQIDGPTQNIGENSKEAEPNITKKIRKRTTKKESDIRNYKCSFCNKSYLSYPALYTHCKQKHKTNNHSERGRGRPKKEQLEQNIKKTKYDPLTIAYFQKEERTGNTNIEKINECARNSFKYLYENEVKQKIRDRKMKEYSKIEEHPFLGKFINDAHDIKQHFDNERIATDYVLINYLNNMSIYCNEKYYEKLIIFATLYREHINIINQDKVEKGKEFCQIKDAEDVPEFSNEFITDFLFPDDQDFDLGLSKDEAIDLTRNLCNWMYENNFTCSKLFLLDKEK